MGGGATNLEMLTGGGGAGVPSSRHTSGSHAPLWEESVEKLIFED